MNDSLFSELINFMKKIPSVEGSFGSGVVDSGNWWIKFSIDIQHQFAWHAVQEIGFVANYLSLDERLPTIFYPVSPPPYLNGGPKDFLSWVIESKDAEFTPSDLKDWLETRLPNPVDDLSQWESDDEVDEDMPNNKVIKRS
jgi:hypothetical protein